MGIALKKKLPLPDWPGDRLAVDRELFRAIRERFIEGGLAFEAAGSRTKSTGPKYDLQYFIHRSGMRVAVISPGDQFRREDEISQIVHQTAKNSATPAELVLFVDHRLHFRPARVSNPAYIQYVTVSEIATWIDTFIPPLRHEGDTIPPRKRAKRVSAARIKANLDGIIVSAAALELLIQSRIDALKDQRKGRNSKEAIAECDAAISDFETILRQVAELQREIATFKNAKSNDKQVAKAAGAFSETAQKWWRKDGGAVLTNSANAGIVLTMVGVLSLMGLASELVAVASIALVGGKPVASVLKGLIKIKSRS